MQASKLFVKTFLSLLLFGISAILVLNFCCDPIQYYRHSPNKKLNGNDRWQVAGFIRSFDYDQIVLGTSMTQNFSLKRLKENMNSNPIRLSVAGLDIQGQAMILKAAIQTGKVKSVIWGIDRNYLEYIPGKYEASFPVELYAQTLLGHLNYLLNVSTTSSSIKILSRLGRGERGDLDEYNAWYRDARFSKEIVLKQFNDSLKNVAGGLPLDQFILDLTQDPLEFKQKMAHKINNFHHDVVTIIKNNPEIQFYLFFPPYSLAYYKLHYYADSKLFMLDAQLRHHMMEALCCLPNVSFHDFETHFDIISDLNHYKDLTHYSKDISDRMIQMLAQKKTLSQHELETKQTLYLVQPKHAFK